MTCLLHFEKIVLQLKLEKTVIATIVIIADTIVFIIVSHRLHYQDEIFNKFYIYTLQAIV